MMREIEAATESYTDERWKAICEALRRDTSRSELIKAEHKSRFDKVSEFVEKMSGLNLSYAASIAWLAEPDDLDAGNARIIQAKEFAYLLYPLEKRSLSAKKSGKNSLPTDVSWGFCFVEAL